MHRKCENLFKLVHHLSRQLNITIEKENEICVYQMQMQDHLHANPLRYVLV